MSNKQNLIVVLFPLEKVSHFLRVFNSLEDSKQITCFVKKCQLTFFSPPWDLTINDSSNKMSRYIF